MFGRAQMLPMQAFVYNKIFDSFGREIVVDIVVWTAIYRIAAQFIRLRNHVRNVNPLNK